MPRVFLLAALAALLARLVVFDSGESLEAFATFTAFLVCAAGWAFSTIVS